MPEAIESFAVIIKALIPIAVTVLCDQSVYFKMIHRFFLVILCLALSPVWCQVLYNSPREHNSRSYGCSQLYLDYFREFTTLYRGGSCSAWYPYMDCCYLMRLFPYVKSGVYEIGDPCVHNSLHPHSLRMHTKCDMFTAGGGWTVIMQRNSNNDTNSVDFSSKRWDDYEDGFGSFSGDFWFGLVNLRCVTQRETYELRVELTFRDGSNGNIIYPNFQVDTRASGYKLAIGTPVGNATVVDAFARMTDFMFQTSDYIRSSTCKGKIEGGFWAPSNGACNVRTNLFARVAKWMGKDVSSATMMIRAIRCSSIRDCE